MLAWWRFAALGVLLHGAAALAGFMEPKDLAKMGLWWAVAGSALWLGCGRVGPRAQRGARVGGPARDEEQQVQDGGHVRHGNQVRDPGQPARRPSRRDRAHQIPSPSAISRRKVRVVCTSFSSAGESARNGVHRTSTPS